MFPGVGTIINIITIIGGASLGVLVGNRMPTRTRTLLTDVLVHTNLLFLHFLAFFLLFHRSFCVMLLIR